MEALRKPNRASNILESFGDGISSKHYLILNDRFSIQIHATHTNPMIFDSTR